MGIGLGRKYKNCCTNYGAPAPNPDPSRWELVQKIEYKNSYILEVKYLDCTNFEGHKIMVYAGEYKKQKYLDPHFSEKGTGPVARFMPTAFGMKLARSCAKLLSIIAQVEKDTE